MGVCAASIDDADFIKIMNNETLDESLGCTKINQCMPRGGKCCSGEGHHGTLACGFGPCEQMCNLAVRTLVHGGCKAGGGAACEVALGGPEDPLADICATIAVRACSMIANHFTDPKAICSHIGLC